MSSRFVKIGCSAIIAAAVSQSMFAASDTWNQPGGSHSWNSGANWLSGTQFPNGVGDVAYFNNNITAGQSVTIFPPVTVGGLVIGDANGSHTFTIGAFGNILNIDNGGSATTISNTATLNNQILANLTGTGANRDLTVDVATGTSLNIGSTGTQSPMIIDTFIKNGGGALALGTTGSTFTDTNVYVNAGRVSIFGSHSLPKTSVVTLGPTAILNGGGGRDQTVAEIRGTGMFRDGGSSAFVVGSDIGVVSVGTHIRLGGRLRPGDLTGIGQIGTLFIGAPSESAGAPRFESGSESYFDIAGYASFDQIDIRRTFTTINGGDVYINFLSGFAPTNGARFALFIDTNNGGYRADPNGGQLFDNIFDNDGHANPFHGYFIAQRGGTFVDGEDPQGLGSSQIIFTYLIPEPSAVALMILGACGFVLRRRR